VLTGEEVDGVVNRTRAAFTERTGKSADGQPNMVWQKRLDDENAQGGLEKVGRKPGV
jgi:hypothetical protein